MNILKYEENRHDSLTIYVIPCCKYVMKLYKINTVMYTNYSYFIR